VRQSPAEAQSCWRYGAWPTRRTATSMETAWSAVLTSRPYSRDGDPYPDRSGESFGSRFPTCTASSFLRHLPRTCGRNRRAEPHPACGLRHACAGRVLEPANARRQPRGAGESCLSPGTAMPQPPGVGMCFLSPLLQRARSASAPGSKRAKGLEPSSVSWGSGQFSPVKRAASSLKVGV